MSIAIMQPYLFPYIGYFQLIHASEVFVFYDDVNYINRGWINRNRILLGEKDHIFTIPCIDASQNKLIKDIEVLEDKKNIQKVLSTITVAYKKAPFFKNVYPLIEDVLTIENGNTIADIAIKSVKNVCNYIGLKSIFKISSKEYNNIELKKADRLIDICKVEGVKKYINAAGGKELYSKEYFKREDVDLKFLISDKQEYKQYKHTFFPWLSIIDILMFNSREEIMSNLLPSYHFE